MNPLLYWLAASTPFVLVVLAWGCFRRSSYHRGKSEAYQEVADAWKMLSQASWMSDKKKQKALRVRGFMRLALCPDDVREALREALDYCDAYWGRDKEARAALPDGGEPEMARNQRGGF